MNSKTKELVRGMHRIGAVKFGRFTLKSGIESPFYLDLRKAISHPELQKLMSGLLAERAAKLDFDCVLGIPYTALPAAAAVAEILQKPLFMLRKEEKTYGTGGRIVGDPVKKGRCLIIDDLVTTGGSKFETAEALRAEGFTVADILVTADRSAGAEAELFQRGLTLHSLVSLKEITELLRADGVLSAEEAAEITAFTDGLGAAGVKTGGESGAAAGHSAALKGNPLTRKLLEVMERKSSNLILSLDVEDSAEFFRILETAADKIAMVKTHVDIIRDFSPAFTERLRRLADEEDFLVFEDRKFADIGNTVDYQFSGGIYRIAEWADCVTSHLIAGEGTLKGLFPEGISRRIGDAPQAAFLLARMSSRGSLITAEYSAGVIKAGQKNSETVSGYIGHGSDAGDIRSFKKMIPLHQLLLMPGVKLERGKDSFGQQYLTVEEAVAGGADCIIVGRGILESDNPAETAETYRRRGWEAYQRKINERRGKNEN